MLNVLVPSAVKALEKAQECSVIAPKPPAPAPLPSSINSHTCMLKQEQVRLQQSSWTWLLFASKLSQQIQRHIYSRKSNNPAPPIYSLNRFYSIYFIFRSTKSAHSTLNDTWADTQTHHVPPNRPWTFGNEDVVFIQITSNNFRVQSSTWLDTAVLVFD